VTYRDAKLPLIQKPLYTNDESAGTSAGKVLDGRDEIVAGRI
jgi:hypothetical protein